MKYAQTLMVVVAAAFATTTAAEQEQGSFATKLSVGATLTDGNSKTMQGNASLITEGEQEGLGSLRAGIEANYGETTTKTTDDEAGTVAKTTDTTIENVRIFAGAKKTITERTFWSVDAAALYDDIAEIDYRAAIGPGLGLYLIKDKSTSLSAAVGPTYIWEKVSDATEDYLAVRFGERLDYAFSETAKIWQSAEYLPKASGFADYLLNVEIGAEAALNSHLNLRLVIKNKYDSIPGEGLENNELVLIGGIGVSL